MNVETANRLVQLRKQRGYSQEELAAQLGLSRQAISKWERAEASPDTDNLIALAELYGMSLDELLGHERTIKEEDKKEEKSEEGAQREQADDGGDKKNYAHVSFKGIHVEDGKDSVHISWKDGVHVESKDGESVHISPGSERIYVNGEEKNVSEFAERHAKRAIFSGTFATMVTIAFVLLGIFANAWHPAWLLFLLIPTVESLVSAIQNKNAHAFAYPVLVTGIYLLLGFYGGWWHPAWVVFLSIPLFYMLVPGKKDKDDDDDDDD